MKMTGKRSLVSKLRRLASEFETDAERLDGTPEWRVRFKLRCLAGEFELLAASIENKAEGIPGKGEAYG